MRLCRQTRDGQTHRPTHHLAPPSHPAASAIRQHAARRRPTTAWAAARMDGRLATPLSVRNDTFHYSLWGRLTKRTAPMYRQCLLHGVHHSESQPHRPNTRRSEMEDRVFIWFYDALISVSFSTSDETYMRPFTFIIPGSCMISHVLSCV